MIAAAPRTDSYSCASSAASFPPFCIGRFFPSLRLLTLPLPLPAAWFRIFKMLIHTAHCEDTSCRVHSTPSFHSAMVEHLTPIYVPTLDALDRFIAKEATKGFTATSDDNNTDAGGDSFGLSLGKEEQKNERAALWQVTLSWRALGAATGINEEILRGDKHAPSDGKKVCWWAKCDTKEKEDIPYKRCSGCHAVTYVLSLACCCFEGL